MINKQIFRRGLVLTAIAAVLMSTVVYGVTKIYSTGSHINKADGGYTTAPTTQTLKKDIGVAATIPSAFANGYTYEAGYVAQMEQEDEAGTVVNRYKSFSSQYVRSGDEIYMDAQDATKASGETAVPQQVFTCGGVSVNYVAYTTKLAPQGYVKTEEEKAAEAAGTLQFAYAGGKEVTIEKTQMIWWQEDGIIYSLIAIDNTIAVQELVDMAAEVIAAE